MHDKVYHALIGSAVCDPLRTLVRNSHEISRQIQWSGRQEYADISTDGIMTLTSATDVAVIACAPRPAHSHTVLLHTSSDVAACVHAFTIITIKPPLSWESSTSRRCLAHRCGSRDRIPRLGLHDIVSAVGGGSTCPQLQALGAYLAGTKETGAFLRTQGAIGAKTSRFRCARADRDRRLMHARRQLITHACRRLRVSHRGL